MNAFCRTCIRHNNLPLQYRTFFKYCLPWMMKLLMNCLQWEVNFTLAIINSANLLVFVPSSISSFPSLAAVSYYPNFKLQIKDVSFLFQNSSSLYCTRRCTVLRLKAALSMRIAKFYIINNILRRILQHASFISLPTLT